jgi:hypothetical protein
MILQVCVQGQTQLMQVARALSLLCALLGSGQRWHQQGRQYPNDGDDNQQLYQREAVLIVFWHIDLDSRAAESLHGL